MGKKVSWFDPVDANLDEWRELAPPGEFRVLRPDEIPAPCSSELLAKCDSVVVMCSGTECGDLIFVANLHRLEETTSEIDQQPLAIAFLSNETTTSGVLVHHGGWDDRTTSPGAHFWEAVAASGIGGRYPFSELPRERSGRLEDLPRSQSDAFEAGFRKLRKFFED